MSGLFGKPKTPKIPKQEPIEEVQVITEGEEDVRRRERKRLLTGGRGSTIISGILSSLKKRLGE